LTRHNQPKVLYPKDFTLFTQCPEKYYRERIEKRRTAEGYSSALTIGIDAHSILDAAALEYRTSNSVPANLYERAEVLVPRSQYSSDAAWQDDVEVVVIAVKSGLPYLDGESQVIATESTLQYAYQLGRDCPPFVLAAKVDLVLLKISAEGQSYIDVIDYKTGSSFKIDPFQELASRIVVKQNASSRFGLESMPIQSTTIFLGSGTIHSSVIEESECGRRWLDMK
jgi:hypothetical protein